MIAEAKARGLALTGPDGLLKLVTRSPDPTGAGRTRWTMRWKPVLDAFAITLGDRRPAAEHY